MRFNLDDLDQMRQLGAALSDLGFMGHLEHDTDLDGGSIYEILSDLVWYKSRWQPGAVDFRRDVGFHPVAGVEGQWDVYMKCDVDTVTLNGTAP